MKLNIIEKTYEDKKIVFKLSTFKQTKTIEGETKYRIELKIIKNNLFSIGDADKKCFFFYFYIALEDSRPPFHIDHIVVTGIHRFKNIMKNLHSRQIQIDGNENRYVIDLEKNETKYNSKRT